MKCRPSQTRARLEQWARVDRNDRWVIQERILEDPVVQVVKEVIVHPWMEQEEQVERSLPPEQQHHPTRISQLLMREVLAAQKGQKEDQGVPHPSVELGGQEVLQAAQGGLREGREGQHPSVEPLGDQEVLQAAQVGLREDRAVKHEDPVESH